jgi:30S ribosome assembly GTPase
LVSAAKGWGMTEAWAEIEALRRGRDVYVIGTANVGKSTLINQLLQPEQRITTSHYPGTTLQTIRIPLADGQRLIDTPGILRPDRLSEWLTPAELKVAIPQKPLKPKVYQLNEQQTLFFGGLVRLDYVQGEKQSFVCYVSNQLPIHRTKLANAAHIQEMHIGDWLVPPADPSRLPDWQKQRIHLSGRQQEDIVIAGLGFVRAGKAATIELWVPAGIQVGTRTSII